MNETLMSIASMFAGFVIFMAGYFFRKQSEKKTIPTDGRLKDRRMKIMWNPYNEKYYWCILNPSTHVWEWTKEAQSFEVASWKGDTIADWKGEPK